MTRPHRPEQEPEADRASDESITFGEPRLDEEVETTVLEVLRSGWIGTGPRCERFEREFADYVDREHTVAVSTGTAALHVARRAARVSDRTFSLPLTAWMKDSQYDRVVATLHRLLG